jgi:hypothetical protein
MNPKEMSKFRSGERTMLVIIITALKRIEIPISKQIIRRVIYSSSIITCSIAIVFVFVFGLNFDFDFGLNFFCS